MGFVLTRRVLECTTVLPLSPTEYSDIVAAKEHQVRMLALEERLDMVLKNYTEFEHELLQITINHALFHLRDWSDMREVTQSIDRRIINLLSTCRLYLDHLRHISNGDSASSIPAGMATHLISAEYEARKGYRAMEALRNHVQHRGLPTHSISLGGAWSDTIEGPRRMESTTLFLNLSVLEEDRKFKRAVLRDLAGTDDKVPLKPLVRDYVTGIMKVQKGARERCGAATAAADSLINEQVARWRQEVEPSVIGLAAVADQDGEESRTTDLFLDIRERRRALEHKNRGSGELAKIIVSSE